MSLVHGPNCIESQFSYEKVIDIWMKFLPPIRPSLENRQVYEDYIKKIKHKENPKVLILGVTPELRRLAIKHCCVVAAADLHTVMIKAMNHLIDKFGVDRHNEIIVKSNWLAMPFRNGSYDLILGDCSINNLTKKETETLLTESKRLLKKDGYICMRVMVCSDEDERRSILNIFTEHRKSLPENRKRAFRDLYLDILCSMEAYDPVSQKSCITKARKEWRRLYSDNKISRQEFEAFEDVLAEGEYCPTLLKRSDLEEILNQHFKINCISDFGSRFMGCSPIYCLEPRIKSP